MTPTWEVVVVFTAGHVIVESQPDELSAASLAQAIARNGYTDDARRCVYTTQQISQVYWQLKKA